MVGTEEQKENQVSSEPVNDEETTVPADLGVESIDLPFLDADDGEIEMLPLLTPPALRPERLFAARGGDRADRYGRSLILALSNPVPIPWQF